MTRGIRSLLICIFSVACMLLAFAGCSTKSTKAYTFDVDNGDKIKITLNTTDNYDLSSELPFTISKDGKIQSHGTFIDSESYQQYYDAVKNDANAQLIDQGEKDDIEYFFWCYNSSEYNYAIRIKKSQTGVLLGNVVSEDSAKQCFERIEFSNEK